MGATDVQVARLFQRRIALDALFGGLVGFILAALVLIGIGERVSALGSELLGSASVPAPAWGVLVGLPLFGVLLAMLVARLTILRALGRDAVIRWTVRLLALLRRPLRHRLRDLRADPAQGRGRRADRRDRRADRQPGPARARLRPARPGPGAGGADLRRAARRPAAGLCGALWRRSRLIPRAHRARPATRSTRAPMPKRSPRWLQRRRYRSIRLVTSDLHMHRAYYEIGRRVGGDVTILTDAVITNPGRRAGLRRI